MSKQETVEVTVKVHKNVVAFLRDMEKTLDMTLEEYIEYGIYQMVGADLDTYDVFVPKVEEIIKRYDLAEALINSVVGHECKEILIAKAKG